MNFVISKADFQLDGEPGGMRSCRRIYLNNKGQKERRNLFEGARGGILERAQVQSIKFMITTRGSL